VSVGTGVSVGCSGSGVSVGGGGGVLVGGGGVLVGATTAASAVFGVLVGVAVGSVRANIAGEQANKTKPTSPNSDPTSIKGIDCRYLTSD
jgi:hypothetical protein